jgi:restriction endonuclease Mrr
MLELDGERYAGKYQQSLQTAFVGRGILPLGPQTGQPPVEEKTERWIPLENDEWRKELLVVLRNMDPGLFEKLVGEILKKLKFEDVEVKGQTGDGGIDLVCLRKSDFQTDRYYVQCKRYSGKISAEQVRDFRGALSGRGERGIYVTTSSFTKQANAEAKREGLAPLSLIDGLKLCELLQELGVRSKQVTLVSIDPDGLGLSDSDGSRKGKLRAGR